MSSSNRGPFHTKYFPLTPRRLTCHLDHHLIHRLSSSAGGGGGVGGGGVSCKQISNRLSTRLSNRFDNRVERTHTVRSTALNEQPLFVQSVVKTVLQSG